MKKMLPPPSARVAIVDPKPQDFGNLLASAGTPGVSLHFLVSGNDAIRFARRWQTGLWVVNRELCDMTGFDLAEMLRTMRPNAIIFVIGDHYNLDDELQTLTLGLAKYLCKPLEPSWVLPHRESCIPMLAFREKNPSLRVVSALGENSIAESDLLVAEPIRSDDIILPFERQSGRRPAA